MVSPLGQGPTPAHLGPQQVNVQSANDLEVWLTENSYKLANDLQGFESGVISGAQLMKDVKALNGALNSPAMKQVLSQNPGIAGSLSSLKELTGALVKSGTPNANDLHQCANALSSLVGDLHPTLSAQAQLSIDALRLQGLQEALAGGDTSAFGQIKELLHDAQSLLKSPDIKNLLAQHPELASVVKAFNTEANLVVNANSPNENEIDQAVSNLSEISQGL